MIPTVPTPPATTPAPVPSAAPAAAAGHASHGHYQEALIPQQGAGGAGGGGGGFVSAIPTGPPTGFVPLPNDGTPAGFVPTQTYSSLPSHHHHQWNQNTPIFPPPQPTPSSHQDVYVPTLSSSGRFDVSPTTPDGPLLPWTPLPDPSHMFERGEIEIGSRLEEFKSINDELAAEEEEDGLVDAALAPLTPVDPFSSQAVTNPPLPRLSTLSESDIERLAYHVARIQREATNSNRGDNEDKEEDEEEQSDDESDDDDQGFIDSNGIVKIPERLQNRAENEMTEIEKLEKARLLMLQKKLLVRRKLAAALKRDHKAVLECEAKLAEMGLSTPSSASADAPASGLRSSSTVDTTSTPSSTAAQDAPSDPSKPSKPKGIAMEDLIDAERRKLKARIDELEAEKEAQKAKKDPSLPTVTSKDSLPAPRQFTAEHVSLDVKKIKSLMPKRKHKNKETYYRYLLFITTVPASHEGAKANRIKDSEYLGFYHLGAYPTQVAAENVARQMAATNAVQLADFAIIKDNEWVVLPLINKMHRIVHSNPHIQRFVDGHAVATRNEQKKLAEDVIRQNELEMSRSAKRAQEKLKKALENHAAAKTAKEQKVYEKAKELQENRPETKVEERDEKELEEERAKTHQKVEAVPVTDPEEIKMIQRRAVPISSGDTINRAPPPPTSASPAVPKTSAEDMKWNA